MDDISLPDMLRLLEQEESVLTQLHLKVFNELHRLQVEEEMFLRTLERLGRNHRAADKEDGKPQDVDVDADHELHEALKAALAEDDGDISEGKPEKRVESS